MTTEKSLLMLVNVFSGILIGLQVFNHSQDSSDIDPDISVIVCSVNKIIHNNQSKTDLPV